jgi:GTP cyclohydrolase IB
MSRFIEVLNSHRGEVTMRTLPVILKELKARLDAETAHIEVKFPYFVEREAPVTKSKALMDYDCTFIGESNGTHDDFILRARTPVTSLCPCSKEISDYGAHNQRGYITIDVRSSRNGKGETEIVWIEELIGIAERSASSPVYALIKRPDERFVTMQAFDNPVFVEDMARTAAEQLMADERINWFRVHVENDESIHNHNAFAEVEWTRTS